MKKALLTGFEIFGEYRVNPTEILANHLRNKVIGEYQICSLILPTSVLTPCGQKEPGVDEVKSMILAKEINVIISLCIASDAKGVEIEQSANNWIENDRYCAPHENCQPIDYSRPIKEEKFIDLNFWNIEKIMADFRRCGIPFKDRISNNSGNYCCNALIHRVLQYMDELKIKIPFIFSHVPCTPEAVEGYAGFDRINKILIKRAVSKNCRNIFRFLFNLSKRKEVYAL